MQAETINTGSKAAAGSPQLWFLFAAIGGQKESLRQPEMTKKIDKTLQNYEYH